MLVVLVHDRRPTSIGESLSGTKAFYINASLINDWHSVEEHPEFQLLSSEEQAVVRAKFPRSVLIYRQLNAGFLN